MSSAISTMSQMRNAMTSDEQAKRDTAISEFLTDIYTDENKELRRILEDKLEKITGGQRSLYDLTKTVSEGDRLSREQATQALLIAEKEAAAEIAEAARAAARYQAEEDLKEANLAYNTATGQAGERILGAGVAGTVGAGVAGGATAAVMAGLGVSGPVGWVLAAIVGIVAAFFAGKGGWALGEMGASQTPKGLSDEWNTLSLEKKIELLT